MILNWCFVTQIQYFNTDWVILMRFIKLKNILTKGTLLHQRSSSNFCKKNNKTCSKWTFSHFFYERWSNQHLPYIKNYLIMILELSPTLSRKRWQWCWRLIVGYDFWMRATEFRCWYKQLGNLWWSKWSRTFFNYHQHSSSPTSVGNIDVTISNITMLPTLLSKISSFLCIMNVKNDETFEQIRF